MDPTDQPPFLRDFDCARAWWQRHTPPTAPPPDWDRLYHYATELYRWSGRMSLISARDRPQLATRHILPSLAALPVIRALPHRTLVDFGTGAGLPGIPLALGLPETIVILVESRRRRVTFLRHVLRTLNLGNALVAHTRLEQWDRPPAHVDCLIIRAARTNQAIPAAATSLLAPHGVLLHYQDSRIRMLPSTRHLWSGQPSGTREGGYIAATLPPDR